MYVSLGLGLRCQAFIPDNLFRDYEQLGLKFRLYSAEVLFNRGLCMVNTGQMDKGLQMMQEARREKATEEHNVIDEALADQGQGYTVFSIVSAPFHPADEKLLYSQPISLSVYYTGRRRRNSRMPGLFKNLCATYWCKQRTSSILPTLTFLAPLSTANRQYIHGRNGRSPRVRLRFNTVAHCLLAHCHVSLLCPEHDI